MLRLTTGKYSDACYLFWLSADGSIHPVYGLVGGNGWSLWLVILCIAARANFRIIGYALDEVTGKL
ncbi:hypothetical protein [Spirosoma telluris]|uniref:hypothetical protein n=1 Tax=Spirosoma telluris TaxID=2183553 RepID=UPI002FC295C0